MDMMRTAPPDRNGLSRALRWVRLNLFSSITDTLLTLAGLALAALIAQPAISFLLTNAAGFWSNIEACRVSDGACWPFVMAKFDQLMTGQYPAGERWRCLAAMLLPPVSAWGAVRWRGKLGLPGGLAVTLFAIVGGFAILDGSALGLAEVPAQRWGGLTLTLMIAYFGIAVSLPLGVLLALARRSSWPVPRILAVCFIEFWRGVPLVTVLFMASVMLPLFLPQGVDLEKLTRALIAVALFASAYVAEIVRGGLRSIPQSQSEAAESLGLSYPQSLRLVVLPQALRNALPGLIGAFIGLLKDTTLVLVIGLFDFLGMVQLAATDPNWSAPTTAITGYVFAGAIFWMLCFALYRVGVAIEERVPLRQW